MQCLCKGIFLLVSSRSISHPLKTQFFLYHETHRVIYCYPSQSFFFPLNSSQVIIPVQTNFRQSHPQDNQCSEGLLSKYVPWIQDGPLSQYVPWIHDCLLSQNASWIHD